MPRIFLDSQFEFFFYSNDHRPIHVHVRVGDRSCRIETKSMKVTRIKGFTTRQIKKIVEIVRENESLIEEAWDEHFEKKG